MKEIVSTKALTKLYKNVKAVDGISIHIQEGEIYGLIGKNGAGKSSLMKMISGLSIPTSGVVETVSKEKIGTLIENPGLHLNLSGYDNLMLKCIALGIKDKKGTIKELLHLLGLNADRKKVKNYSLGMKQRLGIAMALVGNPEVLILDEPMNGLDPQGIHELRNTILKINQEKHITIIISSHILDELAKIATNFGFINDGKLLGELSARELSEKCSERMEMMVDNICEAKKILEHMEIEKYAADERTDTLYVYENIEKSLHISIQFVQQGIRIKSLSCGKKSLEEFYLELMEGKSYV